MRVRVMHVTSISEELYRAVPPRTLQYIDTIIHRE